MAVRKQKAKLSVNIDHVATLRQARKTSYPDVVEAARAAERAGASGITVHLRVDRRHIQDADVAALRPAVKGKLNVEMSISEEMVDVALKTKPDQVTLVPERPEEVTTEGGLNLILYGRRIGQVAQRLSKAGIGVSLFVDPNPDQIAYLTNLSSSGVTGFEVNTDAYTKAKTAPALKKELKLLQDMIEMGIGEGFHAYAGHGLTAENVGPVAAIPGLEELNIGHALIARSVLIGLPAAVKEMLTAMAAGK
jgi:pyridoxine 5-phosphate synthase